MFGSLDISTSGMSAQRTRMDTIASNIANIDSTRNAAGEPIPYRRLVTLMAQGAEGRGTSGVRVTGIVEDEGPLNEVYDPDHPDARGDGVVLYPNVELATENSDALLAARAFQANVAAFETSKMILSSALRILA